MRTIIFKAKRTDINKEEWVEGYVSSPHSRDTEKGIESYYFNALDESGLVHQCIVSAETICQYTELEACWIAFENEPQECDVWEHDLLEVYYQGKRVIAEVIYDSGRFILASNKFLDSCIPLFEVVQTEDGCPYIDAVHRGNIFDNPGLLK